MRPVVATLVAVDVRSSPELAHCDDQRGFQQAPFVQIQQQRGKRLIQGGREFITKAVIVLGVSVPRIGVSFGGDEPATRLYQAPAWRQCTIVSTECENCG